MYSIFLCNGLLAEDPKRSYARNGELEISRFSLLVQRNDANRKWDMFKFQAFDSIAKYINEHLHRHDLVMIASRPKNAKYTNMKGVEVENSIYTVTSISLIIKKKFLDLNQFGKNDFPEIQDIFYDIYS